MTFIAEQGKSYSKYSEFVERKAIFDENESFIKNYNKRTDVSFKVGHNKLSDWTKAELD